MPLFIASELADWSGGKWEPSEPSLINGISNDSRNLLYDNLYFALKGENFDGHAFVDEAFSKGASGAVVRSGYDMFEDIGLLLDKKHNLLRVNNPGKALQDIASKYRLKVLSDVIAVTGSSGKSTVKEIIAQVLSGFLSTAYTHGNWNNDIGLSLSLLRMDASSQVGVFEMGTNHSGEIDVLCDILKPTWGIVTNVGTAHLEFFNSIEDIAREKACLLKKLPSSGVAFLNRDDSFFNLLSSIAPCRIVTVSLSGDADYVCLNRNISKKEVLIEERKTGDRFAFKMFLPGEYNAMNVLFAIAVVREYGVDWDKISLDFDNYRALPMRWEEIDIGGIRIINDAYNANPVSMRSAIKAFKEDVSNGKKWLVLSDMLELGDKEKEEHIALGEFIGQINNWDGLIVLGSLGKLIACGAKNAGMSKDMIFYSDDVNEAVNILKGSIIAGDNVFVKASRGMHLEKIVDRIRKSSGI